MTQQATEALVNEFPGIDFGHLKIHSIVKGDILKNALQTDYEFKIKPNLQPLAGMLVISTGLKRGYVSHYKLNKSGELILEYYDYPQYEKDADVKPDVVNEKLEGDFWLVMKENVMDTPTYVPFRSGKVVPDKKEWV